jgi:hypothetical protein
MFGLDTISWTRFVLVLLSLCSIYYAGVLINAWLKRSGRVSGNLFENAEESEVHLEGLQPISVSASDYPGELIPFKHVEPVDLKVDFYGDNGIDEGYNVEQFYEDHLSQSPEILENIQFHS